MKIWVGILTVATIGLGIGYGNIYCSKMQLDGNSAGVLISALGVIVALLIGWNIWSLIDMRTVKSELQRDLTLMKKEWGEKIRLSMVNMYYSQYLSFNNNNAIPGAITSLVLLIEQLLMNAEDEKANLERMTHELDVQFSKLKAYPDHKFGEVNAKILLQIIPKIRNNRNYKNISINNKNILTSIKDRLHDEIDNENYQIKVKGGKPCRIITFILKCFKCGNIN